MSDPDGSYPDGSDHAGSGPLEPAPLSYADAGVDLDAADRSVELIADAVRRTRRPEVLGGIGGFGGLFALDTSRYREPVLVSSTDGVGTKVDLARQLGVLDTVGRDLVAMVVDDLVVTGAEPLFFNDYVSVGKLDPDRVAALVRGIAEGCVDAGCALVGGETAEHPGLLDADEFDLAGFGVGVVERDRILGPERVEAGDVLIAMASSGPHSNGYSLVRRIVAGLDLSNPNGLDRPLGEALLEPTRIYARDCLALLDEVEVHAMCHVTGGGLPGNLPRVLPDHLDADVDTDGWQWPAIFRWLAERGPVDADEMWRTFNCGVGMVAVVPAAAADRAIGLLDGRGVPAWRLGAVVPRREDGPRVRLGAGAATVAPTDPDVERDRRT
jgi:phosphoribosylformylglycinamidine cyclo-ligase